MVEIGQAARQSKISLHFGLKSRQFLKTLLFSVRYMNLPAKNRRRQAVNHPLEMAFPHATIIFGCKDLVGGHSLLS
jgi:hypothetical protein